MLRIVNHGLFELFAGWGANLHTSHMSCVMYACTVCGGPLAGGELGGEKSLVSPEHTHTQEFMSCMNEDLSGEVMPCVYRNLTDCKMLPV